MHGLIIGSSNDICSLFDSYLLNHEASTHEITWRMFSTQLWSSSKKNQIKRSSYVIVMQFTNQVIFSSREFRPPEKLEMANLLSDEPTVNSIMPKMIVHVLNVQKSIGLDGFQKDSKTSLFSPNGETDKILAKRKDGFRPGLKGTCLGPYQEFMMFGLQRKSNKEKPQRNSNSQTPFKYPLNYFDEFVSVQEQPAVRRKTTRDVGDPKRQPFQIDVQQICDNLVKGVDKALKDFSKSQKKSTSTRAPVAEPSLFISKKAQDCDLPSLETEFNLDNEQAIVELTVLQPELPSSLVLSPQVFEEEPLDFPHQCPCLDTRICLDDDLGPIFDEEDEPGPVFDEEATSITSIAMENYLCFDPGTTPAPLPPDLQEHCEEPSSLNSLPDIKDFFVSKSVFDNLINSLKIFEPDKCLDQSRFQNVNGITYGIILSFDQFLEHNKGFHLLGRPFDLDLQQTDFCAEKSLDSLVFKGNSFDLSSSRHVLINDELSFRDNGVVLSSDDILVYNTFFEKCLELLINDSQTELKLVCSDVGKDMPILKMNTVVAYLDKILVCNIYFDEHLERLKNVQFVLEKDILICDLNKYLSCTFDPGLLVFVLSIQERQVQPLNESIGRAQQPQIWRSFVVQTGYLGASDRGSVKEGYLNSPKVFCLESNFTRKPTHQGFTEAWNRMKSFTDEEVMNFPNRRFFSPTIREYQISKGDSCPRKNRPEPKPILNEPKVFPQSTSWPNQKHSWPNFKIDKPIFCDQLTCLSLAHVLDDYPKGLDPDLDVLKIEKPFDYFFRRFDVVSLVVLNEQDKHDQFPRRASDGECLRTYASTHEITWRMFSTQLWSSSKKNQIKRSSYVIVMLFTNLVIFSSREFRPPEKLEMANLLSDEPTVNSIMPKMIIHVLNVQKSIGLDGFQKDSKTRLFSPNGETDKILAKRKDRFRPGLKGTCLGPYQEYILHLSKSWSWLYEEVVQMKNSDCNRRETQRTRSVKRQTRASAHNSKLSPKRYTGVSREVDKGGKPDRRTHERGGDEE
ncbi:hypothetical protein IGI04_000738 [Brassica rapa subsp. trilocularis]|uniref:Uncharacterized protein n=1 Tax=Brassica rapa subsp. trilocularis TaxID=1813537 RepID=A0ABQ7NRQ1_BRACM|nr:hypothetical protein IGI04_000738 [Brassica rapa subsp. trilocularis]